MYSVTENLCFFLHAGTPPSGDYPVDSYPVIVEQPGGHKVLIVQAYAYSKYVGNITVWFDEQGEYTAWEGSPILLDKSVPEGKTIYQCLIKSEGLTVCHCLT
jgi:5'-nucleotidase